nr:MAG TPA: Protein of unknown function (DUF3293) [Caudoviricetes sp.]
MANENHRKFFVAKTDLFFNMTKVDDFESIEDTTKKYHEFSIDGKLAILVREEDVYDYYDEMEIFESLWHDIDELYEVQLFRNGKTRCIISKRSLLTYTPDITEIISVDPKEILASIVGSDNISDTDSGVLDEVEDILAFTSMEDERFLHKDDDKRMFDLFLKNINSISLVVVSRSDLTYTKFHIGSASIPTAYFQTGEYGRTIVAFNAGVGELDAILASRLDKGEGMTFRFEFSPHLDEFGQLVNVSYSDPYGKKEERTFAGESVRELLEYIFAGFRCESIAIEDLYDDTIEVIETIRDSYEPVNENHLFGRATSVGAVKLVESARAKAYLHEYASYCKGWGLQGGKFFSRNILENSRAKKAFKAVMGLDPNINTIVIISPANPAPQVLSRRENDERVARLEWKLRNELKEGGYNYVKVLGKYGSVEPSFVIYNMSYYEAEDLATEFGHESFIFCEFDHSQRGNTRAGKVSARMYMKDENGDYNLDDSFEGILDRNNTQRNLTEFYTQLSKKMKFNIPFGDDGSTISERLSEGFEKYMTDTLIASHLTHSAIVGAKRKKLGNERVDEILEGLRSEDTPNSERKNLRLELYK